MSHEDPKHSHSSIVLEENMPGPSGLQKRKLLETPILSTDELHSANVDEIVVSLPRVQQPVSEQKASSAKLLKRVKLLKGQQI